MSRLLSSDKECVADFILLIIRLEGQYEICFRRLEDDNATLQCTIQQYEE